MDGLQVHNSHPEMTSMSTSDTNKVVIPQAYSTAPSSAPYQPVYHQTTPGYQTEAPLPQKPQMPWGLSLRAYTFLIIGITAVVIGAALGGGLGGALAAVANHNSSPTATVTATATATTTATAAATVTATGATTTTGTATATPSTTGVVKNYTPLLPNQVSTTTLNCTDQTTIMSRLGDAYMLYCNTNYGGNDIVSLMAYTLDTCIDACSEMNSIAGTKSCFGIMYNANMAEIYSQNSGNCWLKSVMANPTTDELPPSVGAVLVTS